MTDLTNANPAAVLALLDAAERLAEAEAERDALREQVEAMQSTDGLSIMFGWLVHEVGEHTCGGYGPESNYMHEPGCGFEPILDLSKMEGWPGSERDALAEEVADMVPRDWDGLMTILADVYPETAFPTLPDHEARDAGPRIVSLLRRVDALAAKVDAVRAMHVRHSDHRPAQIINGPWYCCARAQLGAVAMDDCNVCGEYWPCPTIRALDATEADHA